MDAVGDQIVPSSNFYVMQVSFKGFWEILSRKNMKSISNLCYQHLMIANINFIIWLVEFDVKLLKDKKFFDMKSKKVLSKIDFMLNKIYVGWRKKLWTRKIKFFSIVNQTTSFRSFHDIQSTTSMINVYHWIEI